MKTITHQQQKEAWEKEHQEPSVLLQMDSNKPSSGVTRFYEWVKDKDISAGIEMGCGKGRNCIWLAKQGIQMTGFDFSPSAIKEAQKRAVEENIQVNFIEQDATEKWKFDDSTFDFGVDCFALTDIEGENNRRFAINEFYRVIKPGGFLFVYALSTEEEFHREMISISPSSEKNSMVHNTGKFEKVFDVQELDDLHNMFKIQKKDFVIKTTKFSEKTYNCKHHWRIYQK